MSAGGSGGERLRAVAGLELRQAWRRPLYWVWVLILVLTVWGLTSGSVRIQSGDSSVGGTKAFLTSEFAYAQQLALLVTLYYTFFIAVAAGMSVIRDQELRVAELLHATPLKAREYVWGKFAACLLAFLAVLGLHVALSIVFNHLVTGPEDADFIGPFSLLAYVRPALLLGLPTIVFLAGTAFLVGERTRRPILVFVLPVAVLLACAFFLWNWTPSWLDPRIDRVLMLVDPSGFRWLNQTWLEVDRGVDFYNSAPVGYDVPFLLSRVGFLALGILAVGWAGRHFERTARRGGARRRLFSRRRRKAGAAAPLVPPPLAALGMRSRRPGLVRGLVEVARVELRELRSQPGLYIFAPLILLQVIGSSMTAIGAFDTPLLATPGTLAVGSLGMLTTLLCLLLTFYVVESLRREEGTRLASIYYATPVRTTSVIFGKALANSLVGVAILSATLVADVIVLLVQGQVALDWRPFALVWGLVLVPTLLFWSALASTIYGITRSRYTTYGVALAVLIYTGYELVTGELDWIGNWPVWGALRWSDMGLFELNHWPLALNRAMALGLAVLLVFLTVRVFPRRRFDASRTLVRLRPAGLLHAALGLAPWALVPALAALTLEIGIGAGYQGQAAEDATKDYWRKNVATYLEAPVPDVTSVEVALELEPALRWMQVEGSLTLANRNEAPLVKVPLTGGRHWRELAWTMEGEEYEPEDREGLFVFTPTEPLPPGAGLEIGFRFECEFPEGMTKNGGGAGQFVLPSGVVLTSFAPVFAPVVGFLEGVGVDEDNDYEAREYPDDFYAGVTPSAFGAGAPFPVRVSITAPEEYTMNGVGVLVSEERADGKRTVVWATDHPVRIFNVVGGKWDVRRGEGTAIFHHPAHAYNLDEMIEALDAAREYYSEWFREYPWRELKLSEFPALADYAQGFATNITFSESIGFLTKADPRVNLPFMVTAHEAAHQWWGNMLTPGEGPGANVLSEGMAHFSTVLLFDQVKGPRQRIEFCRRIEESYNEGRQVDSERPLVRIDGERAGDSTVTYDKGGWVFWMLLNHMGRENALAGLRSFIAHYETNRDHPVLQDLVAHLRPFAPDEEGYDAFADQWFFDVVLPRYELAEPELARVDRGGELWEARILVRNTGTGRMPVEVAAVRGERFPEEDEDEGEGEGDEEAEAGSEDESSFEEERRTVELGAGEEARVVLRCSFEPERVVVDPDALVLQAGRKRARVEL